MKARCISNTKNKLRINGNLEQSMNFFGNGKFENLKIDVIYEVYSIIIYDGDVFFLLAGQNIGDPERFPAELFEIIDSTIPDFWTTKVFTLDNPHKTQPDTQMIMGYDRFVNDDDHHYGVIDARGEDLDYFYEITTPKKTLDEMIQKIIQ